MQNTDRSLLLLCCSALVVITTGCYAHPGQPHSDDPDTWEQYAIEACQRGHERAYRTYAERAELQTRPDECDDSDSDHGTTPGATD